MSEPKSLYLNQVLIALHDECRERGTHPSTCLAMMRFVLEAHWVNGAVRYDRVAGREISLAELASWGLCSRSQAQRARKDALFQQLVEVVDGDKGRNRLPRAWVREERIYSTLQARLAGRVTRGDQPKGVTQGDQPPYPDRVTPAAGLPQEVNHLTPGDQPPYPGGVTGLPGETKGVTPTGLINRIPAEYIEYQNRVDGGAGGFRLPAPPPPTSSSTRECRTPEGAFVLKEAPARDAPPTEFQPTEVPTLDSQLADYFKTLPPVTVQNVKGSLSFGPKGWRTEPMLQALAELCARQGERSPAAMTKIKDHLGEVYLDGKHELVRNVVIEAAVRFVRDPKPEGSSKFAPSHILLGYMKNSTGAPPPAQPARKRSRY